MTRNIYYRMLDIGRKLPIMDTKKAIILGIVTTILIVGVAGAVVLVKRQQDNRSGAQTNGGAACQPPGAVTGVIVEHPYCTDTSTLECSFNQASCSWDPVSGAVSYNVTVKNTNKGTVVDTKTGYTSTKLVFAVPETATYQCDVTAVNSCGSTGAIGSDSFLCEVGVQALPSPTPGPSVTPRPSTPPPAPTAIPTPKPSSAPITSACGQTCSTNTPCQTGLICSQTTKGQSYCAMPNYQNACVNNPSVATCCNAPITITQLPNSGVTENTRLFWLAGLVFVVLGVISLKFQTSRRRNK